MHFLKRIFLITLVPSSFALAQLPKPGAPQFGAEGRLIVLKVVPGDKSAKLFFVGKEAALIDFNKDHKLLSVTAFGEGKKEELKFSQTGDSYEVQNLPSWPQPYYLDVKSEIRGSVEALKVKMESKKP